MQPLSSVFRIRPLPMILLSLSALSAQPRLHFTDLDSGPNTGGENDAGAFVTIYGERFGATQGGSVVTVGGQSVAAYPFWSDKKVTIQLGRAAASGEVKVNTSQGTSNGLPFVVRAGNIYFVATNGSDTANGSFAAPWRTVQKAVNSMAPGDITYLRGGISETRTGTSDGSVSISRNHGAAGSPKALVGYPGETAGVGSVGSAVCKTTACVEGIRVIYESNYWTIAGLRLVGNNYGLGIRGTGWRVIGNEFTCPWGDGASACLEGSQATYVKAYGNRVHDTGHALASGLYHGIYFSTDSNYLDLGWNSVTNTRGCRGIQIHSSPLDNNSGFNQYGIDIHDNFIKDTQCDGIVLATIDPSKAPVRVYNNVIINGGRGPTTPEGGGHYACIYVAGYTNRGTPGSGTVDIDNNTMINCGGNQAVGFAGIGYARRNGAVNMRMRNNIMVQPAGNIPYVRNWDGTTGIDGSNNLFFGNGAPPAIPGLAGSLNVDPQFINPASDYHLRQTSPAIGAGVVVPLVVEDFDGVIRTTPPDLGAYQYRAGIAPPPSTPQAALSVNPASVSVTGTAGGTNPAARTVVLSNTGNASANWSVTGMPAWASLDATSGTLAAGATRTLTLNFNISGLTAGNQTAYLTFTGGPSPVSLSLSLALAAPGTAPTTGTSSTLTVTPAALSGEYTIGGAMPPTQRVSIRNMGTSTMYWNATSNVAWLKVSPSSGALVPSAALTLTVSCTPSSSMAVGTTVGVITLTGGSSPRTITYSLTVKSATPTAPAISGVLTASPRVMAFSGASQTKPLTITNTGGTSLRWFASPTFSWMRLSLDYGTLAPGASVTINVTVSNAGLSPKLYAGAINISAGTIRTSVTVQYTPFLTTTQTAIIKAELRQDRPLAPERWALVPRAQRLARLVNG